VAPSRQQRYRSGIELHQRRFLQTWALGQIKLWTATKDGSIPIQLFDDRWHTYCGIDLFGVIPRDRSQDIPPAVCGDCLTAFKGLLAQYVPPAN
jgi:hypothetical protein